MASNYDAVITTYRYTKPMNLTVLLDISNLNDSQVQRLWKNQTFIVCFNSDDKESTPHTYGTLTLPDHSYKSVNVRLTHEAINIINNLNSPSYTNMVRSQVFVCCDYQVCKLFISNAYNSTLMTEAEFNRSITQGSNNSIVSGGLGSSISRVSSSHNRLKYITDGADNYSRTSTIKLITTGSNSGGRPLDQESGITKWMSNLEITPEEELAPTDSVSNISVRTHSKHKPRSTMSRTKSTTSSRKSSVCGSNVSGSTIREPKNKYTRGVVLLGTRSRVSSNV